MEEKINIYFTDGHVISDDEEIRYQIKQEVFSLKEQGKIYDEILEYMLGGIFEGDRTEIEKLVKIYFHERIKKYK